MLSTCSRVEPTLAAERREADEATELLTLGVEEEYLVVDSITGALVPRADLLVPAAVELVGEAVTSELNLCQIEVGTKVCTNLSEVRSDLTRFRTGLSSAAHEMGLAVAAVGSHPFDSWRDQQVDDRFERYRRMEEVYQIVAKEQVICGCHVHVGIADRDLAIEVMNRVRPWLAPLVALAANSPFWEGTDTGYDSYRLQVWQRWPTSGMPPRLDSAAEYDSLVEGLQTIDAIEDATFLYWYVRPSSRYPTLEFRPCDVCLSVDDAVVLAGLVRALAWTCAVDAVEGVEPVLPRRELLDAAMWRAARYGLDGSLVAATATGTRPAVTVVGQLLELVRPGLEEHGDLDEVTCGVEAILRRGNGAQRQRDAFKALDTGSDHVSHITATTTSVC